MSNSKNVILVDIDNDSKRKTFIKYLDKTMGIPFSKKQLKPSSPYYDDQYFLSNSEMIQKTVNRLPDIFNYNLRYGSLAYIQDLLSDKINNYELEPGDFIFQKGIPNSEPRSSYPHNIVHVEIYLGPKEETIAARQRDFAIDKFPSQKFNSDWFRFTNFEFRSLEPWLNGIFKNNCLQHNWQCDAVPIVQMKGVVRKLKLPDIRRNINVGNIQLDSNHQIKHQSKNHNLSKSIDMEYSSGKKKEKALKYNKYPSMMDLDQMSVDSTNNQLSSMGQDFDSIFYDHIKSLKKPEEKNIFEEQLKNENIRYGGIDKVSLEKYRRRSVEIESIDVVEILKAIRNNKRHLKSKYSND